MVRSAGWRFAIDRGGTFTDIVARDPEGRVHVHKLLSEVPEQYPDAPLEGMRRLLGVAPNGPFPSARVASVRMGTTLATNALLERKGARVGLLVTRGFRDFLEIAYQDRPDLFALNITKPQSLAAAIGAVDERIMADGSVRTTLDTAGVRRALSRFRERGIESIAVVFLHSYRNPSHEREAGRLAREAGFSQVSLSHEIANEIKAVPRGDTTLVDAYLTPLLRAYVRRIRQELGPEVHLQFMQSDGGLVNAERFSGKDAVLSGPAGGVIGAGHVGQRALSRPARRMPMIGFDMGGTSTDVSRWDGGPEYTHDRKVAGVRLRAPMVAIETVAAGGGSILRFADGRLQVGPESAGANPGPACYGRGGPATVTDANVVLGRIQPEHFPQVFGPSASAPLDPEASRAAIEALCAEVETATGASHSATELAAGFIRIANENMVTPIKEISVSRGFNIQEHALICFGGAGAQHACAIADSLGIRTIVIHPLAGVLSAYGIGVAQLAQERVASILGIFDGAIQGECANVLSWLESENAAALAAQGASAIRHMREYELRYAGTDSCLAVPDSDDVPASFEIVHRRNFGFAKPGHPIEVVSVRVRSISEDDAPMETLSSPRESGRPAASVQPPTNVAHARVWFGSGTADSGGLAAHETPVFPRDRLEAGMAIQGPALIVEPTSTILIDPGWRCEIDVEGVVIATRQAAQRRLLVRTDRDPVLLEVFNNLFMSVADQMGRRLENVAHSVNIKERLDFSCAIFTADGDLVANAHHIPVHLGAMGESVKAVLRAHRDSMVLGDAFATNDPYDGGSHLPDVTVVTPVFDDRGACTFIVANRGHHADIGGIVPGSMPPFSRTLHEEGVVLRHLRIVHRGIFAEDAVMHALRDAPFPARTIAERLSDLHAQVASNTFGAELLRGLCEKYGDDVVHAYMNHLRDNASEAMREVLRALPDGVRRFDDRLDAGARIVCTITIDGDQAHIDFTGTDPQVDGNLNTPRAVVVSAVLYVLRTLIGRPIPLNAGCLEPIRITIPGGCLLSPTYPAAVAGGNVETSQRIVDVLYGAFGVVAASQGTMNNLTFGNDSFGYYETICGGAGAGNGFHGASAVHTHMTNTRITDPEVLEHRYPVILREFRIRKGSGGDGQYRGGDGVVRTVEFREPVRVSILSERRETQPYGLHGGAPGAAGRNTLIRAGGSVENLSGHALVDVEPGDWLTIETPGGGGYGKA